MHPNNDNNNNYYYYAMRSIFNADETDAVLLIDASNAFYCTSQAQQNSADLLMTQPEVVPCKT